MKTSMIQVLLVVSNKLEMFREYSSASGRDRSVRKVRLYFFIQLHSPILSFYFADFITGSKDKYILSVSSIAL